MNLKINDKSKNILLGIIAAVTLGTFAFWLSSINAKPASEAANVSADIQSGVPSSEQVESEVGLADYEARFEQQILSEEVDADWQTYLNSQQNIAETEETYEYSEY